MVCFHCSQINAWQNVVLFRGWRDREENRGHTHTHTRTMSLILLEGLFLCFESSQYFMVSEWDSEIPWELLQHTTNHPVWLCCMSKTGSTACCMFPTRTDCRVQKDEATMERAQLAEINVNIASYLQCCFSGLVPTQLRAHKVYQWTRCGNEYQ